MKVRASAKKICKDFERRKVDNLLQLRKKIEIEQNPLQKIIYKSLLTTNVDCINFDSKLCKKRLKFLQ
jgi:hypothetical protein